ncbi:acid protease [Sistotremastrum niveocremeum HHB9708]|uniref:Acid protease n=1 Tax=Sistotremastrum niveocremeum HHB9708 TaxID=1314777 RepID=A0A164Z2L2_9AGAM|nr:acid protease [Sistotremastrum niveocremeum HHB9708]
MFWLPWMLLLLSQLPVEAQLFKRDTVVGTLTVPLALDNNHRYLVQINMGSVGTPQTFNFTLSTTMGYSIVAKTGCSNCLSQTEYNSSQSGSEKDLGTNQSLNFGGSFISGTLIKEDCTLSESNGSAWNYPNQTLLAVTSSNQSSQQLFSTQASGIFGLGLTGPNLTFRDTLYGNFFAQNPSLTNFTYGMALNPPYASQNTNQSEVGGFLHWELPDPSAYTGPITQVPVTNSPQVSAGGLSSNPSSNSSADIQQAPIAASTDWTIQMDGWTASINNSQIMHTVPNYATLDPYFPEIYLTKSEAELIYAAIPASSASDDPERPFTRYTIPCDTQLTFAININSTPFILPSPTLIIQNGTSCVGAIVGWTDPGTTTYLLGSSFISAVYMIFSVGLPGDQPTTVGIAVRSQAGHKIVDVGAIVGGVIGGTAILSIILFGVWFIFFKHGSLGHKRGFIESTKVIDPSFEHEKSTLSSSNSPSYTMNSMHKQQFVSEKAEDSGYSPPSPISSTPVTYRRSSQTESVAPTSPAHTIQNFTHVNPRVTAANMRSGSIGNSITSTNSGPIISLNTHVSEPFDIDGDRGICPAMRTPTSPSGHDWTVEPFYPPSQPPDNSQPQPSRKGLSADSVTPASIPLRTDTETPAPAYQSRYSSNGHTELSPTQTLVQPFNIGDWLTRRERKNE